MCVFAFPFYAVTVASEQLITMSFEPFIDGSTWHTTSLTVPGGSSATLYMAAHVCIMDVLWPVGGRPGWLGVGFVYWGRAFQA